MPNGTDLVPITERLVQSSNDAKSVCYLSTLVMLLIDVIKIFVDFSRLAVAVELCSGWWQPFGWCELYCISNFLFRKFIGVFSTSCVQNL